MRGTPPTGLVGRTAVVLWELVAAGQPVPLSRIARATALPKSTVHRVLAGLAAVRATTSTPAGHILSGEWSDLLRQDDGSGYAVLRRLLTPHLVDLYVATRSVCHLAVRRHAHVRYLVSLYGHADRSGLVRLSEWAPVHSTAAGQVLLAFDPGGQEVLAGRPLVAVTDHTITDLGQLHDKLDEIRRCGLAISRGEQVRGVVGIAVPVAVRAGQPACALSVCGPAGRVKIREATGWLRRTAHAASLTLRSSR